MNISKILEYVGFHWSHITVLVKKAQIIRGLRTAGIRQGLGLGLELGLGLGLGLVLGPGLGLGLWFGLDLSWSQL